MAKRQLERQIRYNFETDATEQEPARHRWTFLIINEPREIIRIRNRIYEQLQPIVDLRELDRDLISGTGCLHYDIFCFSTTKSSIDNPKKIYKSDKLRRDRDLREESDSGLVAYIASIMEPR